jgi:hypothetical protein
LRAARLPARPARSLWTVSFSDRQGDQVCESREVFIRDGRHYRFLDRLARAVRNPAVRWVDIDCNGVGACRRVGRSAA